MFGSNYTQTTDPYKQTLGINFYQPPTIEVLAPSSVSLNVSAPLHVQLTAVSALSSQSLRYGNLQTSPEAFSDELSLNETSGEIVGQVSANTIGAILDLDGPAMISVHVTDGYGGLIVHSITLSIEEAPIVFDQQEYIFSLPEAQDSDEFAGSFSLIDPNGDPIHQLPHFVNSSANSYFVIISMGQVGHFRNYDIYGVQSFDFEDRRAFYERIEVSNAYGVSMVTVRVDVLPVNEYPPVLSPQRYMARFHGGS